MKPESPEQIVMRRQRHLDKLMRARTDEIVAHRDVVELQRTAKIAGCTDVEIQGALRFIERAAEGR